MQFYKPLMRCIPLFYAHVAISVIPIDCFRHRIDIEVRNYSACILLHKFRRPACIFKTYTWLFK